MHLTTIPTLLRKLLIALLVLAVSVSSVPAVASAGEASGPPGSSTVIEVAHRIGADPLIEQGFDGTGIDVAVIDTGVAPVPGLDGDGKLLVGPDLSFEAGVPELNGLDSYGHGTVMASIIAGSDGPDGFRGIAPGARILSVKVADNTGAVDVSQVIAGLDWVIEHGQNDGLNVRVINLSYVTDSDQPYVIDPLARAVERAWLAGYVVVVSAGNAGDDTDRLGNPANDPYVIAVAASDGPDAAAFSNRGSDKRSPDVLAPGYRILGLAAPGSRLAHEYPEALIDGMFLRGSGTSQAAAVVSGAAALLVDQRPELTPDQVKALLIMGTVDEKGKGRSAKLSPLADFGEYFDLLDLEAEKQSEAAELLLLANERRDDGDVKGAIDAEKDATTAGAEADKYRSEAEKIIEPDYERYLEEAAGYRAEANTMRSEAAELRLAADASLAEASAQSKRSGKEAEDAAKELTKAAEDLAKDAAKLEKDAASLEEKALKAADKAADEVEKLTADIEKIFRDWDGNNLGGIKFDRHGGSGMIDIERSAAMPAIDAHQTHQTSDGSGSLEAARGSNHVLLPDGSRLEGEITWSGNTWSGNTWSGNTWSGSTWSGNTWSGNTWSGNTWSGNTWSGSTWSGNTWSGNTWSGNTWSGNTWSGNTWSGNTWSGNTWSGSDWA